MSNTLVNNDTDKGEKKQFNKVLNEMGCRIKGAWQWCLESDRLTTITPLAEDGNNDLDEWFGTDEINYEDNLRIVMKMYFWNCFFYRPTSHMHLRAGPFDETVEKKTFRFNIFFPGMKYRGIKRKPKPLFK